MTTENTEKLILWAKKYNNKCFITNDPIQVPNQYRTAKIQDLEISAFLTAFLSFGKRTEIIKSAYRLNKIMQASPFQYLMSKKWNTDFPNDNQNSFYRMISFAKMHELFLRLFDIYSQHPSLENALLKSSHEIPFQKLCDVFEFSDKSPQKKMNMFLRWMIRNDGIVDFGVWKHLSPKDLIIPLDTHVLQMSYKLGIIDNQSYSLKSAKKITQTLATIFPNDPCLGDFALFGYGVEND